MARGNLVVFDECGWLDENMMNVYAAFTIVDKEFKLGGAVNTESLAALPREIPNQLLYISSASSIDTPFYKKYRDFSKQMILGNKNYFVADINGKTYFSKNYDEHLSTRNDLIEAGLWYMYD